MLSSAQRYSCVPASATNRYNTSPPASSHLYPGSNRKTISRIAPGSRPIRKLAANRFLNLRIQRPHHAPHPFAEILLRRDQAGDQIARARKVEEVAGMDEHALLLQ